MRLKKISYGIQTILDELTPDRLVFVNAISFDFSLNSDPLELIIRLSRDIIENRREEYVESIVSKFKEWKEKNNWDTPTNIVLIPMDWDLKINV